MATMYPLENADTPEKVGRNYKNFGIMGLIQMTEEQKQVEGNYNKAVFATNAKLQIQIQKTATVASREAELAALKADFSNINREADIQAKEQEIATAKQEQTSAQNVLKDHVLAEKYFKWKKEEFIGTRAVYDSRNFMITPSTEYDSLPYQRGVRLDDVVNGACRSTYLAITVMPKPAF